MRRRSIVATAAMAVLLAGLLAACDFTFGENADDATADDSADEIATPVVTQPPSPFCVAVDELERRIDESSTDSDRAIIVEAYTEMLDLVPPEVRPDFEAVLAELRGGSAATVPTTAPIASVDLDAPTGADGTSDTTEATGSTVAGTQVFEEGYTPEETPAGRIGAYVDFACDRSENNPGPPPTQPSEPVPGTTSP
jgi:hypothetical protein